MLVIAVVVLVLITLGSGYKEGHRGQPPRVSKKMGRHRRIPGKKCGGFKDLDLRLEKREKELAKKKDSAPTDLDQQHIPKKLQHIIRSKNQDNKPQFKRQKAEVYRGRKLLDSTRSMG